MKSHKMQVQKGCKMTLDNVNKKVFRTPRLSIKKSSRYYNRVSNGVLLANLFY